MATHNGQNNGYGAHHIGVGSPDDTDEPTPPSGLTSSLHETSTPSWQAPQPTGSFAQPSFTPPPVNVTGRFTSPGFTPPIAPPSQVAGHYSSPGFTPPTSPYAQPSYTPAQPSQVAGNYSSPGFTPPIGPPSQVAGQYSSPGFTPPVGPPSVTGGYAAVPPTATGGYAPVPVPEQYQNLTGQFSIDMLRQGAQQAGYTAPGAPPPVVRGEPDADMRIRYAIWGGVLGAAVGALLGLLNSVLEGVPVERGMQPLMLMTIGMMVITSIICAWFPRAFEDVLRQFGLLSDD
jgi:hypothetical protein